MARFITPALVAAALSACTGNILSPGGGGEDGDDGRPATRAG